MYSQDGNKHEKVKQASANNSPIGEELEREHLDGSQVFLPKSKGDEKNDTDDFHGNHATFAPALANVGGQVEGEENEDEANCGKKHTESCPNTNY